MSWRSLLLILLIACSVGMQFVFEANVTRTLLRLANHLRTESSMNISKKMIKITAPGKGVLQTKRLGRVYLISVGRFGNKLFQYAMLLAVRNLTGRPVYYISSMDLRTTFPTMSIPILNATSSRRAKLRLLKGKLEWITGTYLPHFIPSLPVSDVVICCFFQAFKYFYFIRDQVKLEFTFWKEIADHVDGVLHKARTAHFGASTVHNVRFIGIHVRRGDLATPHMYGKGYRVPDVSYFIKSKAYFQKIHSEPILFVVASDDKDWVQQHLNGSDTYISHEESAIMDLALLAACNDTNRLFSRTSKKTSKLRANGLCAENSPGTVTWKMFPFDDVIMSIVYPNRHSFGFVLCFVATLSGFLRSIYLFSPRGCPISSGRVSAGEVILKDMIKICL